MSACWWEKVRGISVKPPPNLKGLQVILCYYMTTMINSEPSSGILGPFPLEASKGSSQEGG